MRNMKHMLSRLALMVLIVAMVLSIAACGGKKPSEETPEVGEKHFTLLVVDVDGEGKEFALKSAAETVGEALLAEGIIEGEEGPYGLYVKTVDGITLDFDTDGRYWAFYVGEDYATAGVDQTPIEDGAVYAFKAE